MNTVLVNGTRFESIVEKTKRLLLRGPAQASGIRSLSRALHASNDGEQSSVGPADFEAALVACGVELSDADRQTVFAQLDRTGGGTIDPADFITALRFNLGPLRRTWLRRVWHGFRTEQNDCVSLQEMRGAFHPERHPEVIRGERSAEEVKAEFAEAFNASTNPGGLVSHQDFDEYYAGLSAAYCDDETFLAMLRGVWSPPGVCEAFTLSLSMGKTSLHEGFSVHQTVDAKQSITQSKNLNMELMHVLHDVHRPAVMKSALAVRQLSMSVQSADASSSTFLSIEAFTDALRQHRLYFPNPAVLSVLDTNGDGTVDYLFYFELLLPRIAAARHQMLERLWRSVFPRKDRLNRVDVSDFQRRFHAKDGEEKCAFLSSWDVRKALDGKVGFEEVLIWYIPQSATIPLDKEFEALLGRQWPDFEVKRPEPCC